DDEPKEWAAVTVFAPAAQFLAYQMSPVGPSVTGRAVAFCQVLPAVSVTPVTSSDVPEQRTSRLPAVLFEPNATTLEAAPALCTRLILTSPHPVTGPTAGRTTP